MERKKGIIYLCIIVLVMMVVGYFLSCDYTYPTISPSSLARIKAEVVREFIKLAGSEEAYAKHPVVWFDENGGKRDRWVYRYFGIYGDCIILLVYTSKPDAYSIETPWYTYKITGTCEVMMPAGYAFHVVNRDPICKTIEFWPTVRICESIGDAVRDLNWLTERQAEQIARDLEAWFAAGNY